MTTCWQGPLEDRHRELGASFAEFGGWLMPVSYAGTVSEHNATRTAVGLFDVSHLGKALVRGPGAAEYVNSALTNDLGRIGPGKAQYTLCCNDSGGVIDDLIAYYVSDDEIFLVPNAANTAAVVAALQERAPDGADHHRRAPLVRRAGGAGAEVGRRASARSGCRPTWTTWATPTPSSAASRCGCAAPATPASTATSCCRPGTAAAVVFDALVEAVARGRRRARGARRPRHAAHRDGLSAARPRTVAGHLAAAGPLRLGDRLEEGRVLGPRRVAGREGRPGPRRLLRGLRAVGRGVLRADMTVLDGDRPVGVTTSGTFSPTLKLGIALALIDADAGVADGQRVAVDVRGRALECEVVAPPFVDGQNSLATGYTIGHMTEGPLEFTLARNANPASDEVRADILRDPGFGRFHTDHMVSIDYTEGKGWHDARGACRTARSSSTRRRSCCTTRRRSSRGSRPTAGPTDRSCRSGRRPTPPGCVPRRVGWPSPNCPTRCSSSRCAS